MVGVIELESMTSTMSTWRSNQLSYTPSNGMLPNISGVIMFFKSILRKKYKNLLFCHKVPGEIRFADRCLGYGAGERSVLWFSAGE